jgi:hypothetical protein
MVKAMGKYDKPMDEGVHQRLLSMTPRERIAFNWGDCYTGMEGLYLQLAYMVGMDKATIKEIMKGELSLNEQFMTGLGKTGYSINWLLTGDSDRSVKSPTQTTTIESDNEKNNKTIQSIAEIERKKDKDIKSEAMFLIMEMILTGTTDLFSTSIDKLKDTALGWREFMAYLIYNKNMKNKIFQTILYDRFRRIWQAELLVGKIVDMPAWQYKKPSDMREKHWVAINDDGGQRVTVPKVPLDCSIEPMKNSQHIVAWLPVSMEKHCPPPPFFDVTLDTEQFYRLRNNNERYTAAT